MTTQPTAQPVTDRIADLLAWLRPLGLRGIDPEGAIRVLKEITDSYADLYELALAYEEWEADLILSDEAWAGGRAPLPTITQELWDRLLEIQTMRNAAVKKARGD